MNLKISQHVKFPLDTAVTQKFFFAGRSGSGKTYGSGKFTELLYDAGAQVIVIDVIGNWWGLRLAADGKSPGLDIPVIGGTHGDVPVEPTGGNLVADLIVDTSSSMVVDISEFTAGEVRKFVTDFATHLLHRKKMVKSPLMIIWEECQDVVPQKVMGDEARMLGAMERLIKKGRNYGIGTTLVSQRPQAVNKDVLNQTECMVVFQMTAPHERKAIEEWVKDKSLDRSAIDELPKLKKGECFIWSPSWLETFERTKILEKKTYDASATPEFGSKEKSKQLVPIDLEKFKGKMQASIEKAKENDPTLLKNEVFRLRKANLDLQRKFDKPVVTITPKQDSILINMQKELKKSEAGRIRVDKMIGFMHDLRKKDKKIIEKIMNLLHELNLMTVDTYNFSVLPSFKYETPPTEYPKQPIVKNMAHVKQHESPMQYLKNTASDNSSVAAIGKCERAILVVLASRFGKNTTKKQAAILSGYSVKSGSFNNSISKIKQAGYIEASNNVMVITDDGLAVVGDYTPLPTGEALHNYWYNELGKCEAAILKCLIDHGVEMGKDAIADITKYSVSSGSFNNSISKLRTLELIEGKGMLKASDALFE